MDFVDAVPWSSALYRIQVPFEKVVLRALGVYINSFLEDSWRPRVKPVPFRTSMVLSKVSFLLEPQKHHLFYLFVVCPSFKKIMKEPCGVPLVDHVSDKQPGRDRLGD